MKGLVIVTIGGISSSLSSTAALQAAKMQGRIIPSTSDISTDSSSATQTADTVEISDEAYALYNASKSQGAAPPPPPPPPPSEGASSSQISDILDALVSDGTLTSDQATSVFDALTSSEASDEDATAAVSASTGTDADNPLKTALDALVSDGTLTSDEATSLLDALKPPEKPEEAAFASGSTDNPLKTALDALVSDGTLTSDQLNAFLNAVSSTAT